MSESMGGIVENYMRKFHHLTIMSKYCNTMRLNHQEMLCILLVLFVQKSALIGSLFV